MTVQMKTMVDKGFIRVDFNVVSALAAGVARKIQLLAFPDERSTVGGCKEVVVFYLVVVCRLRVIGFVHYVVSPFSGKQIPGGDSEMTRIPYYL